MRACVRACVRACARSHGLVRTQMPASSSQPWMHNYAETWSAIQLGCDPSKHHTYVFKAKLSDAEAGTC
eukprot:32664-Chlamydomonas_euryale.AAC.1